MAEMDITVLETREATTVDRVGAVQRILRTSFLVGAQGPFTVELPVAEFSADRVLEEAEKIAAQIRRLPNRTA